MSPEYSWHFLQPPATNLRRVLLPPYSHYHPPLDSENSPLAFLPLSPLPLDSVNLDDYTATFGPFLDMVNSRPAARTVNSDSTGSRERLAAGSAPQLGPQLVSVGPLRPEPVSVANVDTANVAADDMESCVAVDMVNSDWDSSTSCSQTPASGVAYYSDPRRTADSSPESP